jgi:hypothetical protein
VHRVIILCGGGGKYLISESRTGGSRDERPRSRLVSKGNPVGDPPLTISPFSVYQILQKELSENKCEHHNCNVPQQYEADRPLGSWVNNTRAELKNYRGKDKTKLDRIKKLNEIGFEWAPSPPPCAPRAPYGSNTPWDHRFMSTICIQTKYVDITISPFSIYHIL